MLRRVKAVECLFAVHVAALRSVSRRKPPHETTANLPGNPTPQIDDGGEKDGGGKTKGGAGTSQESFGRRLFTSWQQGVVASMGAVMGIGAVSFFFYAPVKDDTVHHTAVVASEALGDARLREQAIQLSKEVVENVLKDAKTLDLVVRLVVQVLRQDDTMIAVSSFLRALFEDHYTQEVTKKFVLMTVLDPWIQEQLRGIAKDLAKGLLKDPEVKKALVEFLTDSAVVSLRDEELRYDAARAVRSVAKRIVMPWS
ncbi:uncharacterized protein Tco025E_00523 [Trypanosoma conorhini]|uniref:Uncharacterized protein n=1 Tax=Trypanosoma conorhini TaxID=83891 RepID=A0A3R7M604_9TRYP|nr:uncharacterized protein Tco025E_00523 [Trypanosoma conorhini]RNF27216.1 hypothetical protein Tco025E_00523 [Trypanosoma conorhini]